MSEFCPTNKTVTVYNRFKLTLPLDVELKLKADATSLLAIGGCTETSVSFVDGISNRRQKRFRR